MLVLSRRSEEVILIGDAIVKVLKIRGRVAQIGIQAPESMRILRAECVEGAVEKSDCPELPPRRPQAARRQRSLAR